MSFYQNSSYVQNRSWILKAILVWIFLAILVWILLAILIKGRRSLSENPETQPVVRKARNWVPTLETGWNYDENHNDD